MGGGNALLRGCAVILGLLTATMGCGRQTAAVTPVLPATATTATATPAATAGPSQRTATCASRSLTITIAGNNKSLCVRVGTTIAVFLRGTLSDKWAVIRSDSAALARRPDPRLTLQVGVTGAAFKAAHPGVATVSSVRYPCRLAAGTVTRQPPAMHCDSAHAFRVTLVIESR
jgi:hypothetical protein